MEKKGKDRLREASFFRATLAANKPVGQPKNAWESGGVSERPGEKATEKKIRSREGSRIQDQEVEALPKCGAMFFP